jgi:hypothetical protein
VATEGTGSEQIGTPPYIGWKTFQGVVEKLENNIVPHRIDRDILKTYAGADQSRILAALKWLGLTKGEENTVEPVFKQYVENADQREAIMREIVQRRYAWALTLPGNATPQQLSTLFHDVTGVGDETRRKAVSFFTSAAEFAGVPLSPLFKKSAGRPRGAAKATTPRRTATRRRTGGKNGADSEQSKTTLNEALDSTLVSWLNELPGWPEHDRAMWFRTFKAIYDSKYPTKIKGG